MDNKPSMIIAGVLLYMLAPLGMTLSPLLVGAAAADLGFSDSQVGYLASADLFGIAVAAVLAPFWLPRIPWKTAALFSIVLLVAGNVLSAQTSHFEALCAIRFVTELGSGGLFTLALTTLAQTKNPDRFFSIGIGATIALSVAVFLWLPAVIEANGINTLFWLQGGIALLITPMCWFLPTEDSREVKKTSAQSNVARFLPLFICFIGFSFFTMAEGGMWAYMERIGDSAGFETTYVGRVLAITQFASLFGSVLAAYLSTRFGRTLPIVGATLIFIVGLYLLLNHDENVYLIAACMTQFAYIFVLPYLMLMCVELDLTGRYYVLTTAFKMGGFSAGPAVVAMLLGGSGYAVVSWVGIAFLVICLLLIAPLSLRLDKAGQHA